MEEVPLWLTRKAVGAEAKATLKLSKGKVDLPRPHVFGSASGGASLGRRGREAARRRRAVRRRNVACRRNDACGRMAG